MDSLHTNHRLFRGRELFYKSLFRNQPGSHSLVTMAKLGILVAVAVFLETVSATSVSVNTIKLKRASYLLHTKNSVKVVNKGNVSTFGNT